MFSSKHALLARLASSLSVLVSAVAAQSNVIVVDGRGGGQFTQIQDAVLAAGEGDTILVRPFSNPMASYLAIDVVGKSLTIALDSQVLLGNVRAIRVRDLGPDQSVVLSRLHANPNGSGALNGIPAIWLQNNQGRVRLLQCNATGNRDIYVSPAVTIESSSRAVALAGCNLLGGSGISGDEYASGPGGHGLLLRDAFAVCFDSVITGGRGGNLDNWGGPAGSGGTGVRLEQLLATTELVAIHTSVAGGRGGDSRDCFVDHSGGAGGTGLIVGPDATMRQMDTEFAGGAGGSSLSGGFCQPGEPSLPGEPIVDDGHLVNLLGASLMLTAPTVGREGDVVTLIFSGKPGTIVHLIGSPASGAQLSPSFAFQERLQLPVGTMIGRIPSSGTLLAKVRLPQVPTGATNLLFQAVAKGAGTRTIGSFAIVTVLDSIY